jgi:succinate dehydrogenase/fumarate reductase flavoprotein subunit
MRAPQHWDLDYDVIVAGYGYAGGVSAIFANDAGARTVILEKMAHFGGNSILSGGSVTIADNAGLALQYLRRTCLDATDDDVLRAFATGMVNLRWTLNKLSGEIDFSTTVNRRGGSYPFAGSETLTALHVSRNESYKGFPWAKGTKAGGTLFWVVAEHVKCRPIDVRFEMPVRELVTDGDGVVWRRKPVPPSGICGISTAATVFAFQTCPLRSATPFRAFAKTIARCRGSP